MCLNLTKSLIKVGGAKSTTSHGPSLQTITVSSQFIFFKNSKTHFLNTKKEIILFNYFLKYRPFLSPSPSRYLLQTLTSRRKTLNLNHRPANSSVSGYASQPLPWPFDSNSQRDQQNLVSFRFFWGVPI